MTAQTTAAARPAAEPGGRSGGTGFGGLVRAEWVKFRSVRGWVIGMILAALLMVFIGVFAQRTPTSGAR